MSSHEFTGLLRERILIERDHKPLAYLVSVEDLESRITSDRDRRIERRLAALDRLVAFGKEMEALGPPPEAVNAARAEGFSVEQECLAIAPDALFERDDPDGVEHDRMRFGFHQTPGREPEGAPPDGAEELPQPALPMIAAHSDANAQRRMISSGLEWFENNYSARPIHAPAAGVDLLWCARDAAI